MLYPQAINTSLDKLKQGTIFLPDGKLNPIAQLAKISVVAGVAEIERENLQSMIPVIARLDNHDLEGVMNDIKNCKT
jgi:Cu/Ag efflux pump CusA